jgi:hypothetical protein
MLVKSLAFKRMNPIPDTNDTHVVAAGAQKTEMPRESPVFMLRDIEGMSAAETAEARYPAPSTATARGNRILFSR